MRAWTACGSILFTPEPSSVWQVTGHLVSSYCMPNTLLGTLNDVTTPLGRYYYHLHFKDEEPVRL